MEELKIKAFLTDGSGSGSGSGYGYGYGSGSGDGDGDGYGYGSGYGYGYGDGSGYGDGDGYGYGYGYGYGSGSGDGDGDGYGYGSGYGYGYGDGIKSLNGENVYLVDGLPTIIRSVRHNVARGVILAAGLQLKNCYIVKHNGLFAHGETLKKAQEALSEKIFAQMDVEERIDAFMNEFKDVDAVYDNALFFDWHNKLTGSCEMGRRQFAAVRGLDPENGSMTVRDFLELTKDSFGGEIIRQIIQKINEERK